MTAFHRQRIPAYVTMLVTAALGVFWSCNRDELSEPMTERAVLEDVIYHAATHGTASGFTTSGDFHYSSIDTSEAYTLVFRCQHGRFVVDGGKGSQSHMVWKAGTPKGSNVTVRYQERWNTVDGRRTVVGYQFLDVKPIVGVAEGKP